MGNFLAAMAASFVAVALFFTIVYMLHRKLVKAFVQRFLTRLLTDEYVENIWEIVSALRRSGAQNVFENSLRAEFGTVIKRPLGSPRAFLHFDGLMFNPAQIYRLTVSEDADVDTRVIIGPRAKKPLTLQTPLIVAAFGYGVGVSEKVKLALARGARQVGTASNTGEGPFLQSERDAADFLIVQYHRGAWLKEDRYLTQADAIEIHFGQGATAGLESVTPPELLTPEAQQMMGLKAEESAVIRANFPNIKDSKDLRHVVHELKEMTGGVPIGVKMLPTHDLERDLQLAVEAGVDFVTLDGAQAATKGSPIIIEDNFGLPTVYALCRAARFLKEKKLQSRVSLLVSGGLSEPGHYLKALALGADAVYIGSALLFAMTHVQVTKSVPWENPLELVLDDGNQAEAFDADEAERCVVNFFTSSVEEMKLGVRALGKRAISEVNRSDLCALDSWTADVTGVGLCYGAGVGRRT
ncbi:FMN-binding glutamate synthase family protein [Numidum massiliense]|uniref:FMN-binding glutamate synthase family protein n=1 Tax=Numidum massiliense TaxID=1522315 RepID=UPI0006D59CCD|nr:FMN-binding glutamate synthase family protein [Numidum massiliense]